MPYGNRMVIARNGAQIRMRPNGRPADLHMASRGMDIHHGLTGYRRVEVEHRDGTRILVERGGRGYVQHRYFFHGHEYGHRTYFYRGRLFDHYYRRYPYHGVFVEVYTPAVYYRAPFYTWAYYPWPAPVPYAWGWAGYPWYTYYAYYFVPYPVYPNPSLWLTDYLMATSLGAAYQAQLDAQAQAIAAANTPPPDAAPLTADIKQLISQEVQRQVALEYHEAQTAAVGAEIDPASSGIQQMLSDGLRHIFIADRDLDVTDYSGRECALSPGDALQLAGPPAPGSTAATLVVLSSKGGPECQGNATVAVSFADLQEMQNRMRETIDQGMAEAQQSRSLPALPAGAQGAVQAPIASAPGATGPDPSAAAQITQQSQEADHAERDTLAQLSQASSGSGASAANSAPAPVK